MARVQQPELHQFVRLDVCDELGSRSFPRRAPLREVVLDDPLEERLGDDRPGLVRAEAPRDLGAVGLRRRRRDPVDHRRGEGDLGLDPVRELRIGLPGEAGHRRAGDGAVVLDVVAGQHGERRVSELTTTAQGRDDQVERRGGRTGHERPGLPVDRVAALGDREGQDADRRVGEPLDGRPPVVGRVRELEDRADVPGLPASVGVFLDQCVSAVTGVERVAHRCIGGEHSDGEDAPVAGETLFEQSVDRERLVRPVEASHADVRDAALDAGAVVAGGVNALHRFLSLTLCSLEQMRGVCNIGCRTAFEDVWRARRCRARGRSSS